MCILLEPIFVITVYVLFKLIGGLKVAWSYATFMAKCSLYACLPYLKAHIVRIMAVSSMCSILRKFCRFALLAVHIMELVNSNLKVFGGMHATFILSFCKVTYSI